MAPIFVGSNNENSRIRSNRIGFAASTSDPGSAAEGDGYYNSSDNQLKFYDGSAWSAIKGSGAVELVASGTLSNGQAVIVQSDGKAVGVASTSTGGFDAKKTFLSAQTDSSHLVYDSYNNKVVIFYADNSDSQKGYAIVADIDENYNITLGTPVKWHDEGVPEMGAAFDSISNKIVIAFRDGGDSGAGKAIVGTVNPNDNSISFGALRQFESGTTRDIRVVFDPNQNKFVIFYKDNNDSSKGKGQVAYIEVGVVSFGNLTTFNNAVTNHIAATFDSNSNKFVVAYQDGGDSNYGRACVGTVSGNSLSFGSDTRFESAVVSYNSIAFDSNSNKVVIAYRDGGNSNYGTAVVGTVSGTSISFGTPVVFNSGSLYESATSFDSNLNKVVIAYSDAGSSDIGEAVTGTVSGTSITFGSEVTWNNAQTEKISSTFASNVNKVIIGYMDTPGNDDGNIIIYRDSNVGTNLKPQNFIGFSDAAYTDGQTANIQIISSIDDAQTGLTTGSLHYVQTDGTLSTTAGNPSVEAGTALSATKIRIKS